MIRLIILVVIVAIVLGYFGYNVEDIVESPEATSNLEYLKNIGFIILNWIGDLLKSLVDFVVELVK